MTYIDMHRITSHYMVHVRLSCLSLRVLHVLASAAQYSDASMPETCAIMRKTDCM